MARAAAKHRSNNLHNGPRYPEFPWDGGGEAQFVPPFCFGRPMQVEFKDYSSLPGTLAAQFEEPGPWTKLQVRKEHR